MQVETLGEFGVFFILFSLGLEFSPVRIKKVITQRVILLLVDGTAHQKYRKIT